MKPKVSEAEFDAMVKQAGLTLTTEQTAGLYDAWWMIEAMIERVTVPIPLEIEPAHMFNPEVL